MGRPAIHRSKDPPTTEKKNENLALSKTLDKQHHGDHPDEKEGVPNVRHHTHASSRQVANKLQKVDETESRV